MNNQVLRSCRLTGKDTVEVIVFDPHETDSPVGQDRRQRPLLLFVHQEGHEVLDLRHVHISPVISAHQDLRGTNSTGEAGEGCKPGACSRKPVEPNPELLSWVNKEQGLHCNTVQPEISLRRMSERIRVCFCNRLKEILVSGTGKCFSQLRIIRIKRISLSSLSATRPWGL